MMVAKKFLDAGHKLNFAVASRKTFSHELSDFGLESTAGEIPVVAIRTAKGEKFVMQEEFSWVTSLHGFGIWFRKETIKSFLYYWEFIKNVRMWRHRSSSQDLWLSIFSINYGTSFKDHHQ